VQEVLDSVAQGKGRVTRVMLDNMVVSKVFAASEPVGESTSKDVLSFV